MKFESALKKVLGIAVLASLGVLKGAWAAEVKELYKGARAQAMGNAFVGLADDEEAIFYNPAGLAGQKKYSINYMVLDLEGSTDIMTAATGASSFKNLSGDSLNVMMGKNIFGHAQFAPSITMSNFGAALLVDEQVAIRAENQALPQIQLGYQQTNGFQVAWGTSLGQHGRWHSDQELRFGLGAKMLWRRGGYRTLQLSELLNVSKDTLHEIAGSYQRGYGFDMGLQYVRKLNSRFDVRWGFAWTDIGDTSFGNGPDPQPANATSGVSATYHFASFSGTVNYDLRHLDQSIPLSMQSHLGLELGLPLIRIYAGLNQAFVTYGFGLDAWLFKLTAVSYAEEQGSFATMDPERRYLLQIALKVGI